MTNYNRDLDHAKLLVSISKDPHYMPLTANLESFGKTLKLDEGRCRQVLANKVILAR
jgi:hypothetical protein